MDVDMQARGGGGSHGGELDDDGKEKRTGNLKLTDAESIWRPGFRLPPHCMFLYVCMAQGRCGRRRRTSSRR